MNKIKRSPREGDHITRSQVKKAIAKVNENKYQWHEKSIQSYYCDKATGRIVGKYSRISFSDVYYAEVNGDTMGEYISENCARKAIETRIAKNDEEQSTIKLAMPIVA
jgi:hypothetical protein